MPYNLFASDKQQNYPGTQVPQVQQDQQAVVPGQVQGETPQQFAAGKQAANSQAQGYGVNPAPVSQPTVQSVAQPVVQQTPAKRTQDTVQNKPAITNMDELAAAMGYTSPQEEERLRKASVANQRIMAIGDALRNIGNIATTINYAPSQKFNNPVLEEYTRYQQGKALRDKANMRYLTYQQAKAAQDAKQKQWEADFKLKLADMAGKDALRKSQIARQGTLADLDKARAAGVITENEYKKIRNEWFPKVQAATVKQKEASAAASRTRAANDSKRTTAYVNKMNSGGGRGGNPYVLPTKNGYLSFGRDLNSNQIGKKALYGKLKDAGIVDQTWIGKMDNSGYTPEEKAALLNTAISQWLMKDDNAPAYMQKHYGAKFMGADSAPSIGWDGNDDEEDVNNLEIGW